MAFQIHLFFLYTAFYLLLSHNANALKAAQWPKQRRILNMSWQNCGSPNDPFQIKSFTLGPDPIRLPGNVTVGISFSFSRPSPTDMTLLVVMEKKVLGFWIKVPCTNNIGSCTYQNICQDWATACPGFFAKFGIPCTCPIPASTYTIPDLTGDVDATLPPDASGDFRVFADLLSGSAGQLGCLQFEIGLG